MKRTQWFKLLSVLIVTSGMAAVLVACDSGGSGSGGSKVVGTITGFGSVYIDGVKYENSGSGYKVDDDDTTDQSDLEVGMVITCENNGDNTCEEIHYDEDLQGPIDSITNNEDGTKTLVVLGINVLVSNDPSVTNFDDDDDNDGVSNYTNWGYDTIVAGDIVEVSGVFNNSGVLEASYIEKEDDLAGATIVQVEFKGTITTFGETSVTIALDSNGLAVITVSYDGFTDFSDLPGGVLATGLFVEVEGMLTIADGSIYAMEIEDESENEDHDYDEGHSSDSQI